MPWSLEFTEDGPSMAPARIAPRSNDKPCKPVCLQGVDSTTRRQCFGIEPGEVTGQRLVQGRQ